MAKRKAEPAEDYALPTTGGSYVVAAGGALERVSGTKRKDEAADDRPESAPAVEDAPAPDAEA